MSVSHKNADLWHIGLDTLNWDGSGDDRSYLSLSLSLLMFLLKHHLKSPGTRLMLSSADKRLRDVYLRGLPYQESATLMSSPHQGGSETALQTLKWTDLQVASYKISWGSIPGPFERLFEVSVVQRNSDVGTLWEVDFFLAAAKKLYLQFPVAKNGVVAVSEAKRTSLTKNPWRGHSCYIRSCE